MGKLINLEDYRKISSSNKDKYYINYNELSDEDKRIVDKMREELYKRFYEKKKIEEDKNKTE